MGEFDAKMISIGAWSFLWKIRRQEIWQDKQMIHDLVIGEMQSFDHINRVLKKCIGEALTECEKSVSRQFSEPRPCSVVFPVSEEWPSHHSLIDLYPINIYTCTRLVLIYSSSWDSPIHSCVPTMIYS